MRPCNECERKGCPDKCKIGARSEKCVECARTGRDCNLAPFSPAKWARLRRLREDKAKEAKAALAKWSRLQAEVELLEQKERKMVEGELENISDLEQEEGSSGPRPDDILFDVGPETFSIESEFDWASIGFDPAGSVPEVVGTPSSSCMAPTCFPIHQSLSI